jgi:hypothetical protein
MNFKNFKEEEQPEERVGYSYEYFHTFMYNNADMKVPIFRTGPA